MIARREDTGGKADREDGAICVECGREWTNRTERWQRYRVDLEETAPYCPDCAARGVRAEVTEWTQAKPVPRSQEFPRADLAADARTPCRDPTTQM